MHLFSLIATAKHYAHQSLSMKALPISCCLDLSCSVDLLLDSSILLRPLNLAFLVTSLLLCNLLITNSVHSLQESVFLFLAGVHDYCALANIALIASFLVILRLTFEWKIFLELFGDMKLIKLLLRTDNWLVN